MPALKELRERAGEIADEMEQMRQKFQGKPGEESTWTDEADKRWNEINAEYDGLLPKIEQEEKNHARWAKLDQILDRARGSNDTNDPAADRFRPADADDYLQTHKKESRWRSLALRSWARGEARTSEEQEACRELNWNTGAGSIDIDIGDPLEATAAFQQRQVRTRMNSHRVLQQAIQTRDLSVGTATAGGHTVPEGFIPQLEVAMLAIGGIERVGDMVITDDGADLPWPGANDTSNEGEIINELAATAADEDPAFNELVLKTYRYSSKKVRVSRELLQDNGVGLEAHLATMLGTRVARRFNNSGTNGASPGPNGILVDAVLGKTTASATAITDNEIIDLEHSVDPEYRGDRAAWMAHDNVWAYIRKIRDSDGRSLWQPGMQNGMPDTMHGYLAVVNQHMPSAVATSNKTLLFGDMSKIKMRRVRTVSLQRLVETAAVNFAVEFILVVRQDVGLLNAGTDPLKFLQQA